MGANAPSRSFLQHVPTTGTEFLIDVGDLRSATHTLLHRGAFSGIVHDGSTLGTEMGTLLHPCGARRTMTSGRDPIDEPCKELGSDEIQCQECAEHHHDREQQKEETALAGTHIILIIGKDVECTIRCPQYRKDWDVIVSHHPQLRERYVKTLLIESYTYGHI